LTKVAESTKVVKPKDKKDSPNNKNQVEEAANTVQTMLALPPSIPYGEEQQGSGLKLRS
jgi:hypothetical protein